MGDGGMRPRLYYLNPPAPNPFGDGTRISYGLPTVAPVELRVFDLAGRCVRDLVRRTQAAGRYSVTWDGNDDRGRRLANGVYFISLVTENLKLQHGRRSVKMRRREGSGVHEESYALDDAGVGEQLRAAVQAEGLMTIHTEESTLENIFVEMTGRTLEA